MNALELHPLDTLFFRDARPMEAGAGSGGHGAYWPLPTIAHEAMRTALLRAAGEIKTSRVDEGHHRYDKHGKQINNSKIFTKSFRSLRTRGPFPCKKGDIYLPCPAELVRDEAGVTYLMAPLPNSATSDLNSWLRAVASPVRASKGRMPQWIPLVDFVACLSGQAPALEYNTVLYEAEHRIGIGINAESRAAADGKLYSAEHLRLAADVCLWLEAGLSDRKAEEENHGRSMASLHDTCFGLGGEGRMVRVCSSDVRLEVPAPRERVTGIKWTLATHAVFAGGWRPGWVDANGGKVRLKTGDTDRRPDEDRATHRERFRSMNEIDARLVAVRNEKPCYFSGWDLGEQGAKPTMAAVPAGSVYYFEAATEAEAGKLVRALHGRTRSDFFGEKGMGFGFCGTWKYADVARRPMSGATSKKEAQKAG